MSPANIDLTAKKLAEQKRKREAAQKELNKNSEKPVNNASNKKVKFRLPSEEEYEKATAAQEKKPTVVDKNAPRKITIERYTPPKEKNNEDKTFEQPYNLTPEGKVISEPKKEIVPGFRHFVTDIIDSNEVFQMRDDFFGLEYGSSIAEKENLDTYEEVLSNPDILQKLRDKAISDFSQLNPNKEINPYLIDMTVRDVVKTRIAQEKQEKQAEDNLFIKQEREKGNYLPSLNEGVRRHMEEIDPAERMIAANIKLARSLQKTLDDQNAPDYNKRKAAIELEKLGGTLEKQLKDYDAAYSYMFDNKTGRRLSKAEAESRESIGDEDTMSNRENELIALKNLHKDQDLESLERGYFTHINRYNNYEKKANKTYNINPNVGYIRDVLQRKGYKIKEGTNEFEGVKAKDLVPFLGSDYFMKDLQKSISSPANGKAQITEVIKPFLEDLSKEKAKLQIEREAYKTTYLMNIDPKSLKQTALGTVGRFAEAASEATIGDELTRKIGVTDRKELDEIQRVFESNNIKPSEEQAKAFKRETSMKVAEGVGAFVPELVKFAAVNAVTGGILGTTGYGARLAALGRSKNVSDRLLHLGFNALKEEITFKTATLGESQTGGGAGFYLGGQAMNKLVPFRFGGALARFNPFIEKVALAGPGMIAGSEAAAFTEAVYKDLRGKESFKTSIEDLYGKDSEFVDRMVVNGWVGALIGTHNLKSLDLKSMSEKRAMFDTTINDIAVLEAENNPANKKQIEQKKNLIALLDREIQIADRNFLDQNIGDLKSQMMDAQNKIDTGKLNEKETLEAQDIIAKGQAHIVSTRRSIERKFKAVAASGVLGENITLNIFEGPQNFDGSIKLSNAENKAEFDPKTNSININILKYKKGVLAQEMGHAMMKVAFKNDPALAEKLKNTIKNKVESSFAGKKFNDGKTFEEAINDAYGENLPAEEYVMNVVEFLQDPKYRDVLLNNDFFPTLKRAIGELGNKIGLDLTSNKPLELGEKNLNRASDLLEFLYDLGNVSQGESPNALKKKFENFANITIDGKKLVDLKSGSEISTEQKELNTINEIASKEIGEDFKKDIFSKATQAYEEAMKTGGSSEIAGLMVGMKMEPLVKNQVERYLTSKGITMSRDQLEDIVSSITTDSGPGTFGIPNLVEAWSKGQKLIEYIKTEKPSREAINSKAKELNIQDRTSAGSDSSTIDKYIKMAEGNTEQAQLTSYIFGNLPKRILQTLQKSEFADSFNTFSIEGVKNIDKLEESIGLSGASSGSAEGYIDTSSPEQYPRVSKKKAENILQLPNELAEKINTDANKLLNSQKLENLDAKAIGTVPLKDGGKAKVAMLESDKARIIYPDGRVEIIKARSPKLVEQHLGAPDKSFEKQFNFKEGLAEDFKNSLFTDLSKHAGNLINNVKATPEYEAFIDNAFPLFKDYISQSAVNKRFAEFKEPFIDKATGKQAREKTAAGNPIFTKKNVTLAEWRKYFLGDGTQRIDGKRRSIIEALATELGFDATMDVLGKEAMRKQVESRQEDLSVELVDNYVAVIAKQIDRNNPTAMASKIIEEVRKQFNLTKEEAINRLRTVIYDNEGNIKSTKDILSDKVGEVFYNIVEGQAANDVKKQFDSKIDSERINTNFKQKLAENGVTPEFIKLDDLVGIDKLPEKRVEEYENFVKDLYSFLPEEVAQLTSAQTIGKANTIMASLFGYTSRKNYAGDKFNRDRFQKLVDNITYKKSKEGLSTELQKGWDKWISKAKEFNKNDKGITITTDTQKFFDKVEKIQRSGLSNAEKISLIDALPEKSRAEEDIKLKSEFLNLFLNTVAERSINLNKEQLEKFAENISVMLLNNDGVGMRKYSAENYMDLTITADSKIKNEHLKSKAEFAADVIKNIIEGTLNKAKIDSLTESFESLIGGDKGQLLSDFILGKTSEGTKDLKMTLPQAVNLELSTSIEEALSNVYNWTTGKTRLQELTESKILEELPTSMASKNLAEDLSNMIERKKGIPAERELSAAKARILGENKGKFKFFVPPNAEDFAGLLYKFYGKGKQGDADMKLMKETLLDPFERGENAISTYRQKLATDLKAMDARLNDLGGEVSKESKEALKKSGFDADQATRVYIWNKQGVEIPDITKNEIEELSSIVGNDARLRSYADGVMGLVDFPAPTDSWYGSNLKYDLYKHSTEGIRKEFLAPWKENMDAMFTPENYNRMEAAYGKDFVDNFKQLTKRMETGKARPENMGKTAEKGLNWINGSVGVIMWMNTRSAVLQTISAVNYINWGDNNLLAAGKTLTKPAEFAKTFKELMNSDFLKQRRDGLEINIEDAEIAKAIEKGGNAPERLFGKLIKAGFKPTQIADSFAIAVGGTPFYMNRTKTYQKEVIIDKDGNSVRKYTDAEAKQKAFDDFRALSEEHQQSSRQDRVSNVQLGVLGRLVFAFNNTPMQMTRLQKKAALDIINRRGDAKTNVSKLVYYGLVQSAIFYALQQGAFGMLFGKDEDELKEGEAEYLAKKKEAKVVGMANGMIDSFLSGAGMTGKLLVTAKNTLLKYQSESEKGYNANYGKVVNEALSLSPPLSSKTKKVTSAFDEIKYANTKKGKIEADKTGILNSPNTIAGSKLIAAGTNIPIDRFLTKINNVATVVAGENVEDWQRIALALGWDKYSLGLYEDPYLDPTEQAAADNLTKKQASEAAKITREAKKIKEKAAYDALPQKSKDSLDFIKFKKAEDKSKKKFIEEEVRKSKLTPEQLEYEKYLAKEKRAKSKTKSKATKLRNQKIKDSINYANTRR